MVKKKVFITLSLISICLLIIFSQSVFQNKDVKNYQNTISDELNDGLIGKLKTSDYSSNYEGTGAQLNITLHQSLINTSTIEFSNLDTSNRFTEPFPNFNGYNTSFINVSFNAIYAPNKTLELETGVSVIQDLTFYEYAFSFEVLSSSILEDFALCFSESGSTSNPATIDIHLYNATYDSVEDEMKPLDDVKTLYTGYSIPDGTTQTWFNFTGVNEFLDISNTNNKTFFIWIKQTSGLGTTSADFHYENDGLDNSAVWRSVGTWVLRPIDASFVVNLSLSNNNANPSDIGLKINNTIVQDLTQGTGYWENNSQLDSLTNELDFDITADWWDVSCNVTNVQINYTKTDLKASSNFNIPSSGEDIQWNVTVTGGLNYFDSRIADFNSLNFTIPETWQEATIKVFNDTTENTNLIKRLLGNGYREVQVLNAGNGTYWHLTTNSTNLLSSIDSYISGINKNVVNFSNTVDFNATFSTLISNGNINLSIYNPQNIDNKLNYSREITTFNPSNVIDLGNWDIASNITQYGNFRVITFWNNNTAAGFLETQITVLGEAEITITQPSQNSIFDSDEIFNTTINFQDIGQNFGIENAIIEYRISGGSWTSDNVTELVEGNYNITINCSDSLFDNYGNFNIEINVSKYLYNNQSATLNFKILGLTNSEIDSPAQDQIYDSDEIVTIVLSFDDSVKSIPIDNADIKWKVGQGGTYSSSNLTYVSGNYQVELWLRHSEFDGYGPFTVYLMLNKTNYYNQTESLNINILGLTGSQLDSPAQDQIYDSDEIVMIVLSFDDSVKNIPIDNADIQWKVGLGGTYSSSNVTYVSGNYQIELWLRHSEFDGYGPFTVYFMLNKSNYYNQTESLNFKILGLTTSQLDSPAQDQSYDSDEIVTIILSYDDSVKSIPIDNGDIQWKVGIGGTYSSTNVSYVSGNYQIEIWLRHSEFNGYGPFTIYFMLNKTNYYNQTESLNINILGLTTSQLDSPAQDQTYDSDEIVTIVLSFDDSIKSIPVDNADIQWKVGLGGTYSSTNVSYVSGNYQIELWLRYSEFDGYGPFTVYLMLNKTNYYNQTESLNINILGLSTSQLDSPAQDQTYDSNEIITIVLSFDDSVKNIPIDNADIQWKVGLGGTFSSTNVSYVSGNYQIELWLRYSEFDGYGPFTIYLMLNKTNYYNQTESLNLNILGLTTSQLDSPAQDQTYDSDEIVTIVLSFDDSIKSIPVDNADIQWKVGLGGTYSSTNVSYVSGNYQIELWLRHSEFDGYGPFTIYLMLNKTNYYNQTESLNLNILGLSTSQIDSPAQDQTYDSNEIITIVLSYDDYLKSVPIDNTDIQWKVGLGGTYSSTNVSYVSGNYQIELWLRHSEFDGYGPFTVYLMLNKTNYYNQTESLNLNILGLSTSQIDSPAQDQTYDSDEIVTIVLSFDDSLKSVPIDNADIQWKVGISGTYSSTNVSYVSGNYQIELWLRHSEFDGYGSLTIYFMLNKTNYYNQTESLNINILGLTASQMDSPAQDQTYDSDEIVTIVLSFDDSLKSVPIDNADIQWKVGIGGTYSSTNVSYVSGNYQIELWLRHSEFDGYGPFTIYLMLNKTNYYNQTESLDINILGLTASQLDSPAQDQTYNSDEIVTIVLSFDDSIKSIPIDNADIQWKVGLGGTYSSTNVTYISGNYQIELWLRHSEFDGYGPFTIYLMLNKTHYYNQTESLNINILGLSMSQIDSPAQDQVYDSDEIVTVVLSYDDSVKSIPIDNADIQWKVGLAGTYSSTNVSYVSGNYQIELWLRHSEFDGYGPFTIYFMLNKTNYYNQTESLNINILGLSTSQIDSPAQAQIYDSNEIITIVLSFDDSVKSVPIDNGDIQWKVGLSGTYSSANVSYVSGNYQIELWLRHSEFDGYGPFTVYLMLNKTNYYNQTESLNINILGLSTSQIDSPAQDQTYNSDEIVTVVLSFDDSVKSVPIDNADILWKVGLGGTFSSTNVTYVSGNYQIELWLRHSEFDGYGPFTVFLTLNKTCYYNQTTQLNFNVLGLTTYSIINLTQYSQQLQNNNSIYEGFQGENITLYMNFINLYPIKLISGAIGNLTFEGVYYLNYSDINGLYSWEIDTSDLLPGSYSFFVQFNKTNYYNQSELVYFDINIISTEITIESIFDNSGTLDPYYDNGYATYTSKGDSNVTFIITYWDINHTYPIIGSNGNTTVEGKEFLTNTTLSNGYAWFTLNSIDYEQADFIINVSFWKPNYYQYTLWFNLSIVKYETNSSLIAVKQTGGLINSVNNGTHYIIYRNYNSTFLVDYWNEDDNIPIENAYVTFILRMGLSTIYTDSEFTNESGQYDFYVPTHDFLTGNYEFTITFSKEDYKTSIIYGNISIILIPTNGSLYKVTQINHISGLPENLTYYSSNNTFVGLLSYNTTIYFTYWDKLNEEWINSGSNCLLLFNDIYYYNISTVTNGVYSWIIPTYDKMGTFIIRIEMTKFNWANVSYQFNLTINSIPTTSQIDTPSQDQTYNSDEILLIVLSFDDILKGVPITSADIEWKVGLGGTYTSTNVTYISGNYQIELWLRHSEFDGYGPFTIYMILNKTYYYNQTLQLDFNILGLTSSQIDSPPQDQTYGSDAIITITLSYDDSVKSIPIDNANIQWKVGLGGTYSSENITYNTGKYQIELWLRYSEFDGYGSFTIYFMLNKTNYYNQTEALNINIIGLTSSQIDLPPQDQTYDSDGIVTITLSFDDVVKSIPIDSANIQWKVGLGGTYSSENITYNTGNYQIELWLKHSEFDGYGPFTIYFLLNKTNYYNQTEALNFNIIGLTTSQLDSPAQDQTYDSDAIVTITLSFDDVVKSIPIDNANIQWKVGLGGTYSSENVTYNTGKYQIELWLRHSEFGGYGSFTIYFILNKTNYYNQTESLNFNILGLTTSQLDSPAQDQTFYSNETLIIELSFDDSVKNIPIDLADIQWKVGVGGTYSSTNISYVSGNYQIELWLRHSEFDGYGPFTIYFMLNKVSYYNSTELLNINIIGLTSINILNITQYNQMISLNGSIYEAQAGENMTVYANFINDYPNKIITEAVGTLTFNGEDYISLGNLNGVFEWEINTNSLPFGLYNFSITFNKTYYENSTRVYDFRINNLIAKIKSIQKPTNVKQGDSFDLSLKLYYELYDEYAINNANISLMIDFGISTSSMYAITDSSGITNYRITVPSDAIRINITVFYSGNGTYTSASLEITDIELIPVGDGEFPSTILFLIIIGGSIGAVLTGVLILRRRSKKKSLEPKEQVTVKPESKITEKSKPSPPKETKEEITEASEPSSEKKKEEKISEKSKPTIVEDNKENVTKRPKTATTEKKKAKKTEKSKSKNVK